MDEQKPNDLFELRLNADGIHSIRRFAKIAKWVFVLLVVFALIETTLSVFYLVVIKPHLGSGVSLARFLDLLNPLYLLCYIVLAIIQTWYYWLTAKQLSRSIEDHDAVMFNQAFRSLLHNAIFGVIVLLMGIMMSALRLYVVVDSYYQYRH
jgi:hypothetical protein